MPVTTAPSTEAMAAIVDRINTGSEYPLMVSAEYGEQIIDPLEDISGLRVDVASEDEEQLHETLATEDRTTHTLRIWVRKKVTDTSNDTIDALKLLVRKIYQRVNNFNSSDGRVKVWECDFDPKQCPNKDILKQHWLFVANMSLRVEVEASA